MATPVAAGGPQVDEENMEAWEPSATSGDEAEAIQLACNQYQKNERCRQSAR